MTKDTILDLALMTWYYVEHEQPLRNGKVYKPKICFDKLTTAMEEAEALLQQGISPVTVVIRHSVQL